MPRAHPALRAYRAKRDFAITSEPSGDAEHKQGELSFVVQKHWARRLHYDFRLELDGTMKSWAVPKGPSLDPHDKRLAVHVEDHPISYSSFEGTIPARQYGAGKVIIWDRGTWHPIGNARSAYRAGNLKFELHGEKLRGQWALVRIKGRDDKGQPWLLLKHQDADARPAADYSVVDDLPDSVAAAPRKATPRRTAVPREKSPKRAVDLTAGLPAEAVRAPLPRTLSPQLATLVESVPTDPDAWRYEIKFDGYRLLVRVDGRKIQLMTRNGLDWTARFPALHQELVRLELPDGWYDGEVVALNDKGVPDFGRLQASFEDSQASNAILYLFDLPFHDGFDLRAAPLGARRALLARVLSQRKSVSVRFSEEFTEDPASIVASACRLGLEGVIAKRADSRYVSRRSSDWIKLKCGKRQEFVVGGYTDPAGSRQVLGSLLLGFYDKHGSLQYAGNVGAGFDDAALRSLTAPLKRLAGTRRPFAATSAIPGRPHWLRPTLVAEVSFSEWTRDGRLRHPVFQGLRKDKDPKSIRREEAVMPERAKKSAATRPGKPEKRAPASKPATSVRLTHGERVIDAASGATKADLFAYYQRAGALLLPHLDDRPVSLVRAPSGLKGQQFFQKHVGTASLAGLSQLDVGLDPGNPPMLKVDNLEGIASAAQWNVIEFHTQNATAADYDRPDRIVFDLDPGERVSWAHMREGAQLLNALLEELGLTGFLKTSGGKGVHIVVPVRPKLGWDAVKDLAGAVTDHMAKTIPARFVAKSGANNRVGKIFIDYLRNGRGSTTVSAWSARARPGLGVSVPLRWSELDSVKSADQWTIANAGDRFRTGNRPWDAYDGAAASLDRAVEKLGKRGRRS